MEDVGELIHSDTTQVWRVGDRVRREAHPASTAVVGLLGYLERNSLPYSPRYLGADAAGRESFGWIEGEPLAMT